MVSDLKVLQRAPAAPRRGAAEGRDGEPCTVCSGKPDRCTHYNGSSVKLWWSWFDEGARVCGPVTENEHRASLHKHGAVLLSVEEAEAEFERRNLELLGRAE